MSPVSARHRTRLLGAAGVSALIAGLAAIPASADHHGHGQHPSGSPVQHVLVLSVDGLHQSDLSYYVNHNPGSALAKLVGNGVQFTDAQTQVPSDSYPGIVGQFTGGTPASTGIWYDDSWNHALLPAGTSTAACQSKTVKPGVEVTYMEAAAKDPLSLDSGQGLANHGYEPPPNNILNLTPDSKSLLDPATLPVDPNTCLPVAPHQYLRVNTAFEVAKVAGLRTAWSDKHAAYEVLNGPSGTGVQDMFTPEINSHAPTYGSTTNDWTTNNSLTKRYDSYKVQAVINEIKGHDHSGSTQVGTPAIFGMNFQTVSTAEKLPCSSTAETRPACVPDGIYGGYKADGVTPGPLLSSALDYINTQVGAMQQAISDQGLADKTAIILSAKHGQSPQTPSALTRIPDGPIIKGLNDAWHAAYPNAVNPLVAFAVNDDAWLMWLNDRSQRAAEFARNYLLGHAGSGNDIDGNPKPYTNSGLRQVFAGRQAAAYFGVAHSDSRVPDVLGIAKYGVVYTGKKAKIAEHGGANPQDRAVPLVVSGDPIAHGQVNSGPVLTTQIAPTILTLLGLDPNALQAVQMEHTATLPVATTSSSGGGRGEGGDQVAGSGGQGQQGGDSQGHQSEGGGRGHHRGD